MPKAEIKKVLQTNIDDLFKTIIDLESYTDFVDGMKKVKIKKISENEIEASYTLSMIKEIQYKLLHKIDPKNKIVTWSLIESDWFSVNNGKWELKKKTSTSVDVKYEIELEFKVPVPSFVLKKLVQGSLPSLMDSFENRANNV